MFSPFSELLPQIEGALSTHSGSNIVVVHLVLAVTLLALSITSHMPLSTRLETRAQA